MPAENLRPLASLKPPEILAFQHWRLGRMTGLELRAELMPDDLFNGLPIALAKYQLANYRLSYQAGLIIFGEQFIEPAWNYQRDLIGALARAELINRHTFECVGSYSKKSCRNSHNPLITQVYLTNEVEQIERASFRHKEQIVATITGVDELIG